jgi:hypothetical protein
MQKKIIGLGFCLLSIVLLAYLAGSAGRSGGQYSRFSDCSMTAQELDVIVSERQESGESLLNSISFNEYDLIFDKEDGKLYYSLIEGAHNSYNPVIVYSGASPTVKIAVQDTQISDSLIENAGEIRVVAYTDVQYSEYRLVCTTLPLINIACSQEIKSNDVSMTFTLFDNRAGATQRITESEGEIHVRGGSSTVYPKKGYKISLQQRSLGGNIRENNVSLLGMRQDGDWILYAAYNDQERIRNVFSSQIWYDSCAENSDFGIQTGMKYEYVELFINHRYWGLYAIGFPIDAKQEKLTQGEYLYQKFAYWNPLDVDLDNFDLWGKFFEVIQKGEPSSDPEAAWAPLRRYYTLLQNMQNTKTPLPELYDFMDMRNAIDIFLYFNLVQGVDNVKENNSKNIKFVYKNTDGYEKFLYIPWDMDQTWGNVWGDTAKNYIAPYGFAPDQNRIMGLNPVYFLLQASNPDIKAQVAERYRALRDGGWSEESLNRLLDEYEAVIFNSGAYARDQVRWPDATNLEDSSVKLGLFREHVAQRLKYLDLYVDEITK